MYLSQRIVDQSGAEQHSTNPNASSPLCSAGSRPSIGSAALFALTLGITLQVHPASASVHIIGDSADQRLNAACLLPDGDVVVAGDTRTPNGDLDGWIARVDLAGNVRWSQHYGGPADESLNAITLAANGDLVAVGSTRSFGAGGSDAWLVRVDPLGTVAWQRALGQGEDDVAADIATDPVEGFTLVGTWGPEGGAYATGWIVDVRENGTIQRETYGPLLGLDSASFNAVSIARDRGLLLGGSIRREAFPQGSKLTILNVSISRRYRWNLYAEQNSFPSTILGSTIAANGDFLVVGEHGDATYDVPRTQGAVARLSADGVVKWTSAVRNTGAAALVEVTELPDGRLVTCGSADNAAQDADAVIAVLSSDGTLEDVIALASPGDDRAAAILVLQSGELLVAGTTGRARQNTGSDGFLALVTVDSPDPCGPLFDNVGAEPRLLQLEQFTNASEFQLVERVVSGNVETTLQQGEIPVAPVPVCGLGGPPTEVSPPGCLRPLLFTDKVTLTWDAAIQSNSDTFNVYRDQIRELRSGRVGSCMDSGVMRSNTTDPELPGAGRGFFYLVSGHNSAGEGPLGRTSLGSERVASTSCP